jgi:hypothetical protein
MCCSEDNYQEAKSKSVGCISREAAAGNSHGRKPVERQQQNTLSREVATGILIDQHHDLTGLP